MVLFEKKALDSGNPTKSVQNHKIPLIFRWVVVLVSCRCAPRPLAAPRWQYPASRPPKLTSRPRTDRRSPRLSLTGTRKKDSSGKVLIQIWWFPKSFTSHLFSGIGTRLLRHGLWIIANLYFTKHPIYLSSVKCEISCFDCKQVVECSSKKDNIWLL